MRAKLLVVGGKANREEIRLKLPAIVGRSRKAGICIDHPTVSRQHCELYEEGGKVYVRDLGSLNGTLVAESQVQRLCLEHGDTMTIGPLTFQIAYEHLGALPELPLTTPAAAGESDSAIEQTAQPELAQTMVDLPRIGAEPLQDLVAPPSDMADDEGFDLSLPSDEAELALPTEAASLPPIDEDAEFTLHASVDDLPLPSDEALSPVAPSVEDEIPVRDAAIRAELPDPVADAQLDDSDELAFDLAPPATEVEAAEAPHTEVESVAAGTEDEFLAYLTDQADAPPSAADVGMTVEAPAAGPLAASAPIDDSPVETELDWIAGEVSPSDAAADVSDTTELDAAEVAFDSADDSDAIENVETIDVSEEELNFDDTATLEMPEPIAAAPPTVAPAAPVKKAKRGLWPFSRKRQTEPAAETPEEAPEPVELAAAPELAATDDDPAPTIIPFDAVTDAQARSAPPEVRKSSDETIVMHAAELFTEDADADHAAAINLNFTRELSHEKTLVVEESAAPTPETVETSVAGQKAKRGFLPFGKKDQKAAAANAETATETAPTQLESAVEVAPDAVPTDDAPKKRGWWPFAKKAKSAAAAPADPIVTPAEVPASAPQPLSPAAVSPNPASFEFSADELMEITADSAPPTGAAPSDPQALAADEILDFELDVPLHDSSASIEPILSDAPPPTTGADDDDFLDFLAEELPATKPSRGTK